MIGICFGLVMELFGNGGAITTFGEDVISSTVVSNLLPMSSWRTGS